MLGIAMFLGSANLLADGFRGAGVMGGGRAKLTHGPLEHNPSGVLRFSAFCDSFGRSCPCADNERLC